MNEPDVGGEPTQIGGPERALGPERTLVPERTLGSGQTMQVTRAFQPDANRTQVTVAAICPVCKSSTPHGELYCGDCGFLLTTTLTEPVETSADHPPPAELVDVENGRRYPLRFGINTVGRQGTDVLSSAETVSRMHARIVVEETAIMVEDLGSSNGTSVGDRKLAPNDTATAALGAQIRFGNWRVKIEPPSGASFAAEAATIPAAPERTLTSLPSPDAASGGSSLGLLCKKEGPAPDVPIYAGSITIGRRASNLVALPQDVYVSGRHSEVVGDASGVFLVDLGSTNGTFVNGERLEAQDRRLLLDGDEVQIGQSKFTFKAMRREPTAGNSAIGDDTETAVVEADRVAAEPAVETETGNVPEEPAV